MKKIECEFASTYLQFYVTYCIDQGNRDKVLGELSDLWLGVISVSGDNCCFDPPLRRRGRGLLWSMIKQQQVSLVQFWQRWLLSIFMHSWGEHWHSAHLTDMFWWFDDGLVNIKIYSSYPWKDSLQRQSLNECNYLQVSFILLLLDSIQ